MEYLKYRTDLNFEYDFGSSSVTAIIATWWDVSLFRK